ncbi:Caveolae-associated protein 4a [Nibea albiflora]|uniref:Caveolae-associated protein 4a n=1 Tax=Nibea albiflora TaxID=240163 RepID=A0ACB7FHL0_NIBAL|nr:Caveolae-associated protein 4a [Nibea albiflora]
MQKTRKVSANVKEVRARVEKQNVCVKKVETTQDELLTRNKFRVVIYQGETEVPSVAVTKSPKGTGLDGLEIEPDLYDVPVDLSSDEEYLSENMSKTKDNLGTKFHNLGEKVMPPERRDKMHQAGERLKQSGERLKENIAKKAPSKETFRIKLKKERAVAEGQEGAEAEEPAALPGVTYTEVAMESKREGPVEEAGATRIGEEDYRK